MAVLCAVVCPHSSCRRGREEGPATSPGSIGNQQVYAPGTSLLGFEVHFCIFFFCCVKEEKESRQRDPFSNWLTQTLWDKSWTPTPERGLG